MLEPILQNIHILLQPLKRMSLKLPSPEGIKVINEFKLDEISAKKRKK